MAMSLGSNAWENQNAGANVSSIGWSLSVTTTGGTYDNTGRSYYRVYTDNYDTGNVSFKISKTTTLNFSGTTQDYAHNNDGSLAAKNVHFILYDNANSKTYTNDKTVNFTTYARYFSSAPTLTLVSKTETTATFSWTTSEDCDQVQYKINSGSWVNVSGTGRSGTYTITGLSANTSYTIYGDWKRSDSQQWSTWGGYNVYVGLTTYNYPYISSAPSFVIGNANTIGIYNPLKRSVAVYIKGADNTQMGGDTTTGTSITGYNNSSWQDWFYSTIPNSTSGTYKVRLVCSSLGRDTTVNGGTYSVNTSASNPTFNLFEYEDINSTTLALTGNSQTCVLGYSTIKATISTTNKATANNSATMSKYRLTIGTATNEANYSSSEAVTMQVANATSSTYSVYAIDSRGLSTQVTLTGTEIPYTNIVKDVSNSSTLRNGGVSEFVTLTLNGSIWVGNFGQVNNGIESVTYRFKKANEEQWVTGTTTITPILNQDGTFEFEGLIAGNNSDNGFDLDSVYNIEVTVTDKLSSTTYTFTLGSGKPHVAYYKDGVSIMGAYDETIGGTLQVNGAIRDGVFSREERKVGYWEDGKPIYQKTVDYSGSLSSTGTISHNISDINVVIDYIGIFNGFKVPYLTIVDTSRTRCNFNITNINTTDIKYQTLLSSVSDLYVTIWYTKTTDTETITSE